MELGIATFADMAGRGSPEQRMRELMEEIALADQLGLDVFGLGEHHRPDFLISSPTVVLGAAAVRTSRIRLSSAVTVLSSEDPVRVFQQFAEVDLLSGGRAEIMAGRGSFTESFPLFGYDLDHYDELYAEKLELLLALREEGPVNWSGRHRAALTDTTVWPRPVQKPLLTKCRCAGEVTHEETGTDADGRPADLRGSIWKNRTHPESGCK